MLIVSKVLSMTNSHPDFKPQLTPLQMIKLGAFGGFYFGKKFPKDFPLSWGRQYGLPNSKEISVNAFAVDSGLSLAQWQEAGWINKQDPLGWFQWYCRFYLGRRTADNDRQVARWKAYTRHYQPVLKKGDGDLTKRRVQRQSLLHWGYDPLPDFENLPKEKAYDKIARVLKSHRLSSGK